MKTLAPFEFGPIVLAIALFLLIGVGALRADDDKEEKVALKDCPKAVQSTINKHLQGGTILEIEKETSPDGKVTYEAEIKRKEGGVFEMEVAEDGKLLEIEEEDGEDDD